MKIHSKIHLLRTRACGVYTEAATYCQNLLILLRIEDEL
jgi:hypothetical protein